MKKYDNYKDSGVEWIGNIPFQWSCTKLKFHTEKIIDGAHFTPTYIEKSNDSIPFLRVTDLHSKEILLDDVKYIPTKEHNELIKRCKPEKGDLLLSKNGTIGLMKIIDWDWEFSIFVSLCLLKFEKSLLNKFFYYFFESNIVDQQLFESSQKTSVSNLHLEKIKELRLTLPPIEEQTAIANYLDHKTTQIEHLIAKKEQFIQLLEEERVAVINQAVIKGIVPNVEMKDSGIEWLGEIPEHWELKRMKYLCDVTTGGKDTENREDDGEYPFFVRSQTIERISTYSFDGEAILTAGDGVGVCKVWHYVNEKFDFHQRVYMMCNFKPVLGKYLFYYLKENFGKEVMKLSAKSTVDSLRRPMFQNFMVCFGSLEEQKQIISHIEKEELRIETLINKYHQEIELLKEYKTALISEVVTGKVDVRNEKLN
jgi:type I restriction enzyme S subunit